MSRRVKISRVWLAGIGGFLLGVIIILAIRFFTYDAGHIHYHANFGVYINGQQEQFKGPAYYEEETACKAETQMTHKGRVPMHDKIYDVVHVHDRAVTWGQFFENLGWSLGKDWLTSQDKIYASDRQSKLSIILNGQNMTGVSSITNSVIKDLDKLLVSYGSDGQDELQKRYAAISDTARQHDQEDDPASCSGPSTTTLSDRLHHIF